MKLSYTILYVSDVSKSVEFYQKAFSLKQRFIHESGDYAEMETGATALAFASNNLAKANLSEGFQENNLSNPPAGIEISFTSDNVETAFLNAVNSGAIAVVTPKLKPWGQKVAYVRDIDGILIAICSPI
jgi:lactoylglutathione lyase